MGERSRAASPKLSGFLCGAQLFVDQALERREGRCAPDRKRPLTKKAGVPLTEIVPGFGNNSRNSTPASLAGWH